MGKSKAGELEQARLEYTFRFRMRLADGLFSIGKILSFGVPLFFIWKVFETIGGKTTVFTIDLIVKASVIVSMASVAAVIAAVTKMRKQKGELIRCRNRIAELEKAPAVGVGKGR